MKKYLLTLIISLLFLFIVIAYEDYIVSDSDFTAGYTKDLVEGDKFTVTIDGQKYFVQALSIYQNLVYISVSGLSNQESLSTGDNKKYEVTFDNYYDISVKLNSVKWVSPQEKSASITIKKIHEEISSGTDLPDTCLKYYTCPDGTKIKQCEPSGQGCLCKEVSSSCPKKEQEPCEKFYTCSDGSKVQYCFIQEQRDNEGNVVGAGCGCKSNPASLCPKEETPTTIYSKSCSYIWDSSPHLGQRVKITASIKDSRGNTDSDAVQVEIVEGNVGGGGSGHSMDGKILDIQINEPRTEKIMSGAIEIKISSKGPNELGEMSLSFSGQNWGAGFPISNKNCVTGGGGSSSSGFSGEGTCEKYHTCKDGTEIQYCEIIKQYNKDVFKTLFLSSQSEKLRKPRKSKK